MYIMHVKRAVFHLILFWLSGAHSRYAIPVCIRRLVIVCLYVILCVLVLIHCVPVSFYSGVHFVLNPPL